MAFPVLESPRLILRQLQLTDQAAIALLLSDRRIAATTENIPHPYPVESAERFIRNTHDNYEDGAGYSFALVRRSDQEFMGVLGIHPNLRHLNAGLGYWIGVPYWGQGYMTEAVQCVIQFGFEELELNRIYAAYFVDNPASGRVMEKAGMTYEGTLRQHMLKWGEFKDLAYRSILREEWENQPY